MKYSAILILNLSNQPDHIEAFLDYVKKRDSFVVIPDVAYVVRWDLDSTRPDMQERKFPSLIAEVATADIYGVKTLADKLDSLLTRALLPFEAENHLKGDQ